MDTILDKTKYQKVPNYISAAKSLQTSASVVKSIAGSCRPEMLGSVVPRWKHRKSLSMTQCSFRMKNEEPHLPFLQIRDVNSGTFGFVELALDKSTGQQVAIKFIDRGEKVTKYVQREILNHRCLMHPHVVQFKEVFLTPQYLAIAMEFVAGGDMFEFVVSKKGLKESEARMEIASRDIKLENTLLDTSPRPLVKICDFGYSKHEKFHSAPGSRVGTPAYLAPEVIMTTKGQTYDGKISDIWSCGVMLYVMLVGGYPFERPEDKHDQQKLQKMIQRILKVEYDFPPHVKVSSACRDLLKKILVDKPEMRITIPEIQKHPWYIEDLPPGVAEMNDNLPVPGPEVQSIEEITRIVEEAQQPPSGLADWDNDEYLDGALNQEGYAGGAVDEWGMNGSI